MPGRVASRHLAPPLALHKCQSLLFSSRIFFVGLFCIDRIWASSYYNGTHKSNSANVYHPGQTPGWQAQKRANQHPLPAAKTATPRALDLHNCSDLSIKQFDTFSASLWKNSARRFQKQESLYCVVNSCILPRLRKQMHPKIHRARSANSKNNRRWRPGCTPSCPLWL